ncbi:MAG: hypothetical protein NVS9B1_18820 [Candidatus Dormibacteraceae bacterium]
MADEQRSGFRSSRLGGGGGGGRGGFDRGGERFQRPAGPPGPPVDYKALVEFVARSVADRPDEVQVESFERSRGTISVTVKMAEEDIGKLIGKGGRNIEALRSLVRAASLRERRRVFVDLA